MTKTATRQDPPSPGPGSYNPVLLRQEFNIQLKGRPQTGIKKVGPAPNSYNPRKVVDAPAVTSPFRPATHKPKPVFADNPAPNAYAVRQLNSARNFTLKSRIPVSFDKNPAVSPQRYQRNAPTAKNEQPSFTMRPRTHVLAPQAAAPAPNAYKPQFQAAKSSPVRSIVLRKPSHVVQPFKSDGPGPGAYNVQKHAKDHEFAGAQMGIRWNNKVHTF